MIAFLYQRSSKAEGKSRLWSARIRLDDWPKARSIPLHVTDKRVAEKRMWEIVSELERETHGVGIPKPTRDAWKVSVMEHHAAFLKACEGAKLSANTLSKYRHALPRLFKGCKWETLRDINAPSFNRWRDQCGLAPKTVNDLLGCARTFIVWMKREQLILADPLADVRKVTDPNVGGFRRSLSLEEIPRLLKVSPPYRSLIYLTVIYTGLRRNELNGLKWDDFNFAVEPATLKVPASLSKNRKEATLYLRPELSIALQAAKPKWAKPESYVFRGQIPRVQTLQKDLAAAGIPFEDARQRRIDLHALRKTYGTLLAASGVSPRVAMELMRHSDMKLTMGVYTDVAQLPIIAEAARLPSFQFEAAQGRRVGNQSLKTSVSLLNPSHGPSQIPSQTGVLGSPGLSSPVSNSEETEVRNSSEDDPFRHKKAPGV